ncbi:hypothetical protein ABTW24_09930 [Sphingobacterium thalpophilum]|uniref:Outer membrane protein beta-barrel domain-containing protein n=1 Tax=Sphingobacterium thalpophilum TaxID=259 RepID=A0ABV4HBQ7_9SPHI|nr:hypothetical protein [Sphingobacterium thalpophilum]
MEKDKNKIDEIFREGLSNAKFDFNESHWQKLEDRLNGKRHERRKNMAVFLVLGAAVAAVFALFFIWKSDQFQLESLSDTNKGSIAQQKATSKKETNSSTEVGVKQKEETRFPPKDDRNIAFQNPIELHDWKQINSVRLVTGKPSQMTSIAMNSIVTIPKMNGRLKPLSQLIVQIHRDDAIEERLDLSYQPKGMDVLAKPQGERPMISLLAGPDLTSVRGAGNSSVSENIGLAYSYPLAKGLHISVGATYAKKNYKSAYRFYSPSNPPEMTQVPSSVSAVCDVIDVPLTANYTVLRNKKLKFNVSAGLSSYFMLKEKYTFDYEGGGNYGDSKKSGVYEVVGENQHIFGVADFSVSIERKISDKVNVGVKPFVKLPLTGIGYGNVDLESKGVAFTLGVSL